MPRVVNPTYVRRWAELAAQGMTIAEIRRAHHERTGKRPDPRTIERALVKTQAEIAERTANAAELQRGMRVHGEQLVVGLDPIVKAIKSTTSGHLNPHAMYAIDSNRLSMGGVTADTSGDSWKIQITGEDSIELRLLKEHLPNDKAWKMLEEFSTSIANWVTTRVNFAVEIKRELNKVPGKLGISSTDVKEPFELAGLAKIDMTAATARIEGSSGVDDLLDTLVDDSGSGGVSLDSTNLTPLQVPDIDKLRTVISDGVDAVTKSSIGRDVLTSWTAFDRLRANLLDELAMLRMTTYLPGTCKSCKRFRLP